MAKIVLSIRPKYTNLILSGEKTVELRRVVPSSLRIGSEVIIYSTSPVKHILAIAKIKKIEHHALDQLWEKVGNLSGISVDLFYEYFSGKEAGFGLVLEEVKILEEPLTLDSLRKSIGFTPPQSFSYAAQELQDYLEMAEYA